MRKNLIKRDWRALLWAATFWKPVTDLYKGIATFSISGVCLLSNANARKVSLDPTLVYQVMQCAYRNGVLAKVTAIQGEALVAVMGETDLNMGDILNRLDEAKEETVQRIDKLLARTGPLLKYANSERLMRVVSRLLDVPMMKRMMVTNIKKTTLRALTGHARPSLTKRLKALAGKAA